MLEKLTLLEKYKPQLIEDVQVLFKDGKLVIPKEQHKQAVEWYHHYLQHPGTTCLEEIFLLRYWKGLQHSVCAYIEKCYKCQVNKRCQQKYSKLPTKLVVSKPWRLYVWTSSDHTLSTVRKALKLTLFV